MGESVKSCLIIAYQGQINCTRPLLAIIVVIAIDGGLLTKWNRCPIDKTNTSREAFFLHDLRYFYSFLLGWPRCQLWSHVVDCFDDSFSVQVDCSISNLKEILESENSCSITIRSQTACGNGQLNWDISLRILRLVVEYGIWFDQLQKIEKTWPAHAEKLLEAGFRKALDGRQIVSWVKSSGGAPGCKVSFLVLVLAKGKVIIQVWVAFGFVVKHLDESGGTCCLEDLLVLRWLRTHDWVEVMCLRYLLIYLVRWGEYYERVMILW